MNIFNATMMVEGAEGFEADNEEEYAEAVQLLIDTGVVWQLQGFFGRTARDMIESGKCHE
jgi:hypothetical protein